MIDGDDLELFERSLRHATGSASGAALDRALVELGWPDALVDDPRTAVSLLFELQGRAAATSSALDAVLAGSLGVDTSGAAVVLAPFGVATSCVRDAAVVVFAGATGVTSTAPGDLTFRPVAGLDPDLGLVEVLGGPELASATDDVWAAGRLALAHELIGTSRTMLDLARAHALERIQFDQPIAQFQAVRHRLAEAYVAIEGAADAASAAWDDGSPLAAAVAKAVAGRSARVVAKHCQQVCAGIGFTIEHPLHRFIRRALVLDRLLGDSKALTKAMGEELLRSRQLPAMLEL